jgi:hypothetical protein
MQTKIDSPIICSQIYLRYVVDPVSRISHISAVSDKAPIDPSDDSAEERYVPVVHGNTSILQEEHVPLTY